MNILTKNIIFIVIILIIFGFKYNTTNKIDPPFYSINDTVWVDSLMQNLTMEQKIAQLFMVAAYSNKDSSHIKKIKELVEKHHIGGLIFFQGNPHKQIQLTNYYQSKANIPLLIGMDAEWGLSMRLDSVNKFPYQMTMGAIQNDSLIYNMGKIIGKNLKRMGVHVNFAPVIDINNNPQNPVINYRSFGENKFNVTRKGYAYMKGMQDEHILACGKHFPGHGDTDKDSHKSLPIINHNFNRLDTLELSPFKELFSKGLGSVMVAHLFIPALDNTPNQATTLSKKVVTGLLKQQLNFKGLIFTDALNMKGVSKYKKAVDINIQALLAGNDILLFADDIPKTIKKINQLLVKGVIDTASIEASCRKILLTKKWVGLDKFTPIKTTNATQYLNRPEVEKNQHEIYAKALTVLSNKDSILPIQNLNKKIASLVIGTNNRTTFQNTLSLYQNIYHYHITENTTSELTLEIIEALKDYDIVIIGVVNTNNSTYRHYGVTKQVKSLINILQDATKTIAVVFANPYSMDILKTPLPQGLIMAYQDNDITQKYAAQLIFGSIAADGKLPVTVSKALVEGNGIKTLKTNRLKYTTPEMVGLNSKSLAKIDSIVYDAIKKQAMPGCQILVAKDSAVVFYKAYGHHTYEAKRPTDIFDIYDLASVTKVAATTQALMLLNDSIHLDSTLFDYIPILVDSTNKKNMVLKDILTHQAQFISWIPFYDKTITKGMYDKNIYSEYPTEDKNIQVADKLYILNSYKDTIYNIIGKSKLRSKKEYKYSDLGYYYMKAIIEKTTNQLLNKVIDSLLYTPMGMWTTGYLPLKKFGIDSIVPTEYDMLYRKQLIHGYVHDQGAAMLGGVGGHAGLFSNANDLAKWLQMLLQNGYYGNKKYLDSTVIKEYTTSPFTKNNNRRAIGFDKPLSVLNQTGGPTCNQASPLSFGHTGFTGTLVWADPKYDLIFIFLSNRVYPDAENYKLIKMDVRTKIQSIIYDAIIDKK